MKYVYGALAVLAFLAGLMLFALARSAVQEIEAWIALLLAAVLMVCAEIAELRAALAPAAPTPVDSDTGGPAA